MATHGFVDGDGWPTFLTEVDGVPVQKTLTTFEDVNGLIGQGVLTQITGFRAGAVKPCTLSIWQNAWAGNRTNVTFATASVRVAPTVELKIKVQVDSFNQTDHATHYITIPVGQLFAMPPAITDGPWHLVYGDRVTMSVQSGNGTDLAVSLLVSGFGGTTPA